MKILYLLDHFESNYPRDQNYIIKYMEEKGYDVTVITSENAIFRNYDNVFFPKVPIIRSPIIGRLRKAKLYFNPLMLKSLYEEFDVVHSFTFFTTSSILGILANGGIRILRSEVGPPDGFTYLKSKQRSSIYSFLVKIYKELYDYITAYNHVEATSLLMLGFDSRKIVVISPMIDYYKFSKLTKSNVKDDEIVLGTISRISPEKGVHRLIPLIKGLLKKLRGSKKFHMVMAGRIDHPTYGHGVLLELRRLLGERFKYLGEVAPPYKFYEMVDVVIVPSIVETGAISVLEAMAAGKVVIASDIYPINLYITHGIDGFLFTKESEAIDTIELILEGSENIIDLGKRAQESVKRYDYRFVCSKLERVYKQG